jgi:hypothetical protein
MTRPVIRNRVLAILHKAAESYTDAAATKVPGIKGDSGSASLSPMSAGEKSKPKGPMALNKEAGKCKAASLAVRLAEKAAFAAGGMGMQQPGMAQKPMQPQPPAGPPMVPPTNAAPTNPKSMIPQRPQQPSAGMGSFPSAQQQPPQPTRPTGQGMPRMGGAMGMAGKKPGMPGGGMGGIAGGLGSVGGLGGMAAGAGPQKRASLSEKLAMLKVGPVSQTNKVNPAEKQRIRDKSRARLRQTI